MQRITAQLPRLVLRAPLRAARPLYLSCPPVPRQSRSFGNSPALYKKKDKAKNAPTPDPVFNSGEASEDLFDQSQLQNGIAAAISRLKDDLSKLRAGGRFNTASLEGLKVQLGKDAQDSVKLGDLAQVVPKGGRMVTILAAEEEPDAHNPLQLNIPIPPPTKESRDQNVRAAKQAFEKAASTGALHRRLQEMQKKKLARPDDVRKAHDQMEKATDKGQKDVKDMFEAARKTLEQT
ncbi:hypothetical protein N7476_000773 [Penicillium atrosanguineum]|uniref:Ribosome recycling factor domain-containing protein n=1 Tax=Penicillium atrosanguineum TaxID=1132637 RepID=A0A9W9QCA7_9EURO|nr:hypothetical protein N7476_000773 [Penicillium atrosanguineum]